MSIEEYRNELINNIKNDYLFETYYVDDKELKIEDIIDLPKDFLNYLEEQELFKRNVQILLKKISMIMKVTNDSVLNSQSKINRWYITTIREFENCYREFAIACGDAILTNDEIYKISVTKSVKKVILNTYAYIANNDRKKVSSR